MLERATDAFAYLTGSFHRSDGDIFASARSALAYGLSPFDRMQCDKITCAFGSTLRTPVPLAAPTPTVPAPAPISRAAPG